MSSVRKFKRGFLDGFYEIFQNDPYIVKMSSGKQKKEENGEDTLDKKTFSVFVARKIRDNYMDLCASLPFERMKVPATFILLYLKDAEHSAFFERKQQCSLLDTVFDAVTAAEECMSVQALFQTILQNIEEDEAPRASFAPLKGKKEIKDYINALNELRAESEKFETTDGRGDKYALLTEIKKILKRNEKETEKPAARDFSQERLILSRSLKLCFETQGYGKAWWKRWFEILSFYVDEEALQIAATEAFIDLAIVNLFDQKQIEAKYRNMGDGRDLSQKPQTKNVFAQDITFKDVCETYYIHRLLLSMDGKKEDYEDFKQEFETLLRYHAAYISTASTSRFPAETGRLFSGTTSATGKNTQRTKQLLAIFTFFYFYVTCRTNNALEDFRKFNRAARITVDERSVFTSEDIFQTGFNTAQRQYLNDIHKCINAIQRDFLYIFETTQRIVNAPTRDQMQQDLSASKEKHVAQYMKSIDNKLTALYRHTELPQREGDISLLKKNAENIIRVCEAIDLHIPDSLVEQAMKMALEHEANSETQAQGDEKPEDIARFFMNECLKSLEEKFNEAAEKDFLCNQLLQRQDFASVRMLLFRFAKYNDFTNECVLNIDLLKMRNELLERIDDVLIRTDIAEIKSQYSNNEELITIPVQYSLTFADEIFGTDLFKNVIEPSDTADALSTMLSRIAEQVKPPVVEKNTEHSYRFCCDLDRLILAGVGFARAFDKNERIGEEFRSIFQEHFNASDKNHLDYYFDPFILFGTIVISYLSAETRKQLIRSLCTFVRKSSDAAQRPLQEGCILLLNNVLLQSHIFLSYYERKVIFDCIFATNMYPKQWQAYEELKTRSFYADYAKQEYQYFMDGVVHSPRFIYLAASEAPALPGEKINSGDIRFNITKKELPTLEHYYEYCLRLQYLSWTKNKHTMKAEHIEAIVKLGYMLNDHILEKSAKEQRMFAMGTQMLLVGVSNLIRSNRLLCEDSRTIPYHIFHSDMMDILIRAEYLQRKWNQDYQDYLTQPMSDSIQQPEFWMLCGGLRYIAAIWKDETKIPEHCVHLSQDEITLFANSLNDLAAKHLYRFYAMDHRMIALYTDFFQGETEKRNHALRPFRPYKKKDYLDYDNMEAYVKMVLEQKQEWDRETR